MGHKERRYYWDIIYGGGTMCERDRDSGRISECVRERHKEKEKRERERTIGTEWRRPAFARQK